VLRHALAAHEAEHEAVDGVVLLQPTSPFRRLGALQQAAALFALHGETVVSVSPATVHPAWCFRLEGGALEPFLGWDGLRLRSQELPPAFSLNGSIYVLPARLVRAGGALLSPPLRPLPMHDAREAIDIDTDDDWQAAQAAAIGWASHRIPI
jgi:CMP-N-acetylneuraminic acid synthetase